MNSEFAFIKDNTGLKLLKVSANTVKQEQVLFRPAGKIELQNKEVRYASVKDLKKILKDTDNLQEDISGFIVPVPEVNGSVWNDKIAKMCNMAEVDNDVLCELFDDEIEVSPVRSWYYTNLQKYILKTYLLPLKRFAKSIGKEIVFDLGDVEMQYDLMNKMINPEMIKSAGISMAVHNNGGNAEKELGFSEEDFVITGDFLKRVAKKDQTPKILLIKPIRGVMERFIQREIKGRANRLETPALSASIESVYYCDMLEKSGYLFDVADELHLPKVSDLVKYEYVLICKSCLFTEKERARLDKLQKYGVKINNRELIYSLTQKGENQWER